VGKWLNRLVGGWMDGWMDGEAVTVSLTSGKVGKKRKQKNSLVITQV
jgi:hypothetical protein